MLTLTRRVGERIRIGENIWVTVVETRRGLVRLSFDAPREVPIYREEMIPVVTDAPPATGGDRQ